MNTNYQFGDIRGAFYEDEVKRGGDTPPQLLKLGKFTNNPYSVYRLISRQSQGTRKQGFMPPTSFWARDFMSVSVGATTYPSESKALSALASKWRQTDLSVGMYLSPEGKESAEMVGETLMRIANSARSLKRGDFGGFVRGLNHLPRSSRRESLRKFEQGDLSGSFLSAHLGWSPLLSDIYNLSDNIKPYEKGQRISGGAKGSLPLSLNPPWFAHKWERKSKAEVRFMYELKPPTFAQRFGLDNPAMIAWELVPLSFVADYFLPIGAVIDSLGFISANYNSRGWRKQVALYTYTSTVLVGTDLGQGTIVKTQGTHSQSMLQYSRTPHQLNFSAPFRSMTVTKPESFMRLSTIAALTHQRILSLDSFKR